MRGANAKCENKNGSASLTGALSSSLARSLRLLYNLNKLAIILATPNHRSETDLRTEKEKRSEKFDNVSCSFFKLLLNFNFKL